MLKTLRKNTKLIIWTVILSFSLWGAYSVGRGLRKEERYAGEVFGKGVPYQEFDNFYRAAQIFSAGGKKPEDPNAVTQEAWQNLIFAYEADRRKIRVTDDEVRGEILRLLKAQKIEDPTPEIYERWLRGALRETPQEFEPQIRGLLKIQKLIKKVGEESAGVPSKEKARQRFLLEENQISVEAVSFPSQKEAEAFREKVNDPKKWKKVSKKDAKEVKSSGMINLDSLVRLWNVPEEAALRLAQKEKGSVSDIIHAGNDYKIFYLADKKAADEQKFEKELKDKYLEELKEKNRIEGLITWQADLNQKARLKDYTAHSPA